MSELVKQQIALGWFIVLRADRPQVDPQGQTLVFYREIDADRFIEEQNNVWANLIETMEIYKEIYRYSPPMILELDKVVSDGNRKRPRNWNPFHYLGKNGRKSS